MKVIFGSIIVGGCVLAGCILAGRQVFDSRTVSRISVQGETEELVKSDLFCWNFEYSLSGDKVDDVKSSVKTAKHEIVAMFDKEGLVRNEDYIVRPRELQQRKTEEGKEVYTISQKYEIKTQKMDAAQRAFKASENLADMGITISRDRWNDIFRIKDRKQIEERLIAKAIENAKEKAEKMVKASGGTIFGVPSVSYSYLRFKDPKGGDDEYNWGGSSSIDQIAVLSVSMDFKVK